MYGKRVSDSYPYRAIGKLFFKTLNGGGECSASLIKPGLIITAAHCATEYGGQWYTDFEFVPAYYNGEAPFGRWQYEEVRVTQAYKNGTSFCVQTGVGCVHDVAVLKLEGKVGADGQLYPVGAKVGWLGFAYRGLAFSDDIAQIAQFGYPGSHDGGELMQRTDAPAFLTRSVLEVETSSRQNHGSTGGPWIINFGEQAVLSGGVTLGEFPDSNLIIAVTSTLTLANVNRQMKASALTQANFGSMLNEFCPAQSTDLACVYNQSGVPSIDQDIRVELEVPRNGGIYTGIANIQGWAISPYGIDRIEVYIDGEYKFNGPYGGIRPDVGDAIPSINGSRYSGYSLAFGYINLSAGEHTIEAIAVSRTGDVNSSVSTFTVDKFHKDFIEYSDEVNPENSTVATDASGIYIQKLRVDGQQYDVKLEWNPATQGFEIVKID